MRYLVKFADEISDELEFSDPPADFYQAYPLADGRWHVVGVDRWDYAKEELVFYGQFGSAE